MLSHYPHNTTYWQPLFRNTDVDDDDDDDDDGDDDNDDDAVSSLLF